MSANIRIHFARVSYYCMVCRDANKKAESKQDVKAEIPKFKWSQTKSKVMITVKIPGGVKDEAIMRPP